MRITNIPLLVDIKEEYLRLRQSGKEREEAVIEMQKRYSTELSRGAEDDGAVFWIGLADGQWANREITSEIAKHAMVALDMVENAGWDITLSDISRRRTWYAHAPMPEKKVGKKQSKFRCQWNIGDTFAYELMDSASDENSYNRRYILLRKVSEVEFGDGRLLPIVTLSLWEGRSFPQNTNEYSSVPFMRLNCGRFGLPNYLYEYRAELIIKNQKQLSKMPFVYIGNFPDVQGPADEVVIQGAGYMTMLILECFDREIDTQIKLAHIYENRLPSPR